MKKYLHIIIPALLILAIPITYYLAKRPQTLVQKAAPSTGVYFLPASINISPNTNFSLSADIASGTNQISAVELNIKFNPVFVHVNNISLPGTPFLPNLTGTPQINNTTGTARVILLSNVELPKIGTGTLITVSLTSLNQSGNTQVSFDATTTQAGAVGEPPGTNVIISLAPAQVVIGNASPGPTVRPTPTPTPRSTPASSPSPTIRPSPSPTVRPSSSPTTRPSPSPTVRPSPTPTPRSSPNPSFGPSPTPGSASLVLQIRFEGINTAGTNKTVRVTLKQNGTVRYAQNIVMVGNSAGIYANSNNPIAGLTSGIYDIFVKGPVHLTRKFAGRTLNPGNNTLNLTGQILLAGDAVVDDTINVYDYGNLIDNYKCGSSPPPTNKNCTSMLSDFNYNAIIDIYDYNYMIGNFELTGDQ